MGESCRIQCARGFESKRIDFHGDFMIWKCAGIVGQTGTLSLRPVLLMTCDEGSVADDDVKQIAATSESPGTKWEIQICIHREFKCVLNIHSLSLYKFAPNI
jgi:hypothetical protein